MSEPHEPHTIPTEPEVHVVRIGDNLYADSHVLQTAGRAGGVVSHLGFGDFVVAIEGATLEFVRRDHTTTGDMLQAAGWSPHGRPHRVRTQPQHTQAAEAWLETHWSIHTLEEVTP